MQDILAHFKEAEEVLKSFYSKSENISAIEAAGDRMVASIKNGGKIISCGNGGSMSDAMHFAEELSGRYRDDRPSIPAISISDPSHITCVGNDYGFDYIFSRFIEGVGKNEDILLAISTSGNSTNVVNAAAAAREKGMVVIGLTGKTGGKLSELCHIEIRVPHHGYADRTQELHIKIIHALIDYIEQHL